MARFWAAVFPILFTSCRSLSRRRRCIAFLMPLVGGHVFQDALDGHKEASRDEVDGIRGVLLPANGRAVLEMLCLLGQQILVHHAPSSHRRQQTVRGPGDQASPCTWSYVTNKRRQRKRKVQNGLCAWPSGCFMLPQCTPAVFSLQTVLRLPPLALVEVNASTNAACSPGAKRAASRATLNRKGHTHGNPACHHFCACG